MLSFITFIIRQGPSVTFGYLFRLNFETRRHGRKDGNDNFKGELKHLKKATMLFRTYVIQTSEKMLTNEIVPEDSHPTITKAARERFRKFLRFHTQLRLAVISALIRPPVPNNMLGQRKL